MGGLDLIKAGIHEYFIDLIMQGKDSVDILEANAEIAKIIKAVEKTNGWVPATEAIPTDDRYVLLSFENYSGIDIGRYEEDKDGNGAFYPGDDEKSYVSHKIFVNAWMDLPERYKGE